MQMRLITEPRVVVVGQTIFNGHPEYKVPSDGTDMERLGAFAAKGCYDSYGEDGRSCVDNQRDIVKHRHGSVAEHLHVSLCFDGITRALTLELNRHRPLNISQRSTRYTKEEDASIVLDPYYAYLIQSKDVLHKGYISKHIETAAACFSRYMEEVDALMEMNPLKLEGFTLRKWARGKARNILPHNLETRGTWTGNIRAWRHFIETRSSIHAEEEIRRLAWYVYKAVQPLAPVYFEDYMIVYPENVIGEGYTVYPEFLTDYRKI